MNFNIIKKLVEKIKKPKPQLDTTSTSNETVEYTFTNAEVVPKKESPVPRRIDPTIIIPEERLCNNCKIEMVKKSSGLKHSKNRSRAREYLVCKKCGFEKRLAV